MTKLKLGSAGKQCETGMGTTEVGAGVLIVSHTYYDDFMYILSAMVELSDDEDNARFVYTHTMTSQAI